MRSSRFLATLLLSVSLLGVSAVAWADEASEADAAITEGVRLRREGKDDEALASFTKALALKPTPRARAQMALAEQALGRWASANAHLEEVLATKDDPWVEKSRETLAEALRTVRAHLGRLDVRSNVAGATVSIDGAIVGTLPLQAPLWVAIGDPMITVTAPGHHAVARHVMVRAEGIARESVDLKPVAATQAAPGPGTEPATDQPQRAAPAARTSPTLGWVGIGLGAALAAASGVSFLVRSGKISSYNEDPACPGLDSPTQPAACANLVTSANTMFALGVISMTGAALAAGAGSYVLLSSRSNATPTTARVQATIGPRGFAVAGEF